MEASFVSALVGSCDADCQRERIGVVLTMYRRGGRHGASHERGTLDGAEPIRRLEGVEMLTFRTPLAGERRGSITMAPSSNLIVPRRLKGPAPDLGAGGLDLLERLRDDRRKRRKRIRCPRCAWEPGANARWVCRDGCRHTWNTFDTGGRCPKCTFQWEMTVCLRCHRWSAHADWYEDTPAGEGRA